jgi:hypothetical protein
MVYTVGVCSGLSSVQPEDSRRSRLWIGDMMLLLSEGVLQAPPPPT